MGNPDKEQVISRLYTCYDKHSKYLDILHDPEFIVLKEDTTKAISELEIEMKQLEEALK